MQPSDQLRAIVAAEKFVRTQIVKGGIEGATERIKREPIRKGERWVDLRRVWRLKRSGRRHAPRGALRWDGPTGRCWMDQESMVLRLRRLCLRR